MRAAAVSSAGPRIGSAKRRSWPRPGPAAPRRAAAAGRPSRPAGGGLSSSSPGRLSSLSPRTAAPRCQRPGSSCGQRAWVLFRGRDGSGLGGSSIRTNGGRDPAPPHLPPLRQRLIGAGSTPAEAGRRGGGGGGACEPQGSAFPFPSPAPAPLRRRGHGPGGVSATPAPPHRDRGQGCFLGVRVDPPAGRL